MHTTEGCGANRLYTLTRVTHPFRRFLPCSPPLSSILFDLFQEIRHGLVIEILLLHVDTVRAAGKDSEARVRDSVMRNSRLVRREFVILAGGYQGWNAYMRELFDFVHFLRLPLAKASLGPQRAL